MSITHLEVRRHPLWREQAAAGKDPAVRHSMRIGLIVASLGAISVVAAVLFIVLN